MESELPVEQTLRRLVSKVRGEVMTSLIRQLVIVVSEITPNSAEFRNASDWSEVQISVTYIYCSQLTVHNQMDCTEGMETWPGSESMCLVKDAQPFERALVFIGRPVNYHS